MPILYTEYLITLKNNLSVQSSTETVQEIGT